LSSYYQEERDVMRKLTKEECQKFLKFEGSPDEMVQAIYDAGAKDAADVCAAEVRRLGRTYNAGVIADHIREEFGLSDATGKL